MLASGDLAKVAGALNKVCEAQRRDNNIAEVTSVL